MKKKVRESILGLAGVLTAMITSAVLQPLSVHAASTGYVEAQNGVAPITIDGYYDDWEGYEKGIITYYSNNTYCENHALLLRDDEYLYMYVDMHDLYQSQIPLDSYHLYVGGKEITFFMKYATADGNGIDWSRNVNNLANGVYSGLSVFMSYPTFPWGDAVVEVTDGSGGYNDRMEVRMNIAKLEQAIGLEPGTISSGARVQITMPNVGNGDLYVEGSSTGVILGLFLMVSIAAVIAKKKLM